MPLPPAPAPHCDSTGAFSCARVGWLLNQAPFNSIIRRGYRLHLLVFSQDGNERNKDLHYWLVRLIAPYIHRRFLLRALTERESRRRRRPEITVISSTFHQTSQNRQGFGESWPLTAVEPTTDLDPASSFQPQSRC